MPTPVDRSLRSRVAPAAALLVAGVLIVLAPARADGGGPSLDIATIEVGMTKHEVLRRLDAPLLRSRVGDAGAWEYPGQLSVFFGRRPWRHRVHVVGVRTRNPRDRMVGLERLHVGGSPRAVVRAGGECFTATIPDLGGRDRRGRYCQWPIYSDFDGKPLLDPQYPALIYRIMHGRIAAIRSQYQPSHR